MNFFDKKHQEVGVRLNDVQHEAVVTTDGPVLLLASPGSGKTTTTIMRIGYLIEEKQVKPGRILAVTFSRESAKDMAERFKKLFPNHPDDCVPFSTIHSLAYEMYRKVAKRKGVEAIMIEANGRYVGEYPSKRTLVRELYEQQNGGNASDEEIEQVLTYISFVKNRMLSGSELDKVEPAHAKGIYLAYEEFKRSQKDPLIDYDDMLTEAERILREELDVRKEYQDRFDYVMTDESQDTSLVQHRIIEHLVAVHRNLCVVADDDQSIYSWRGADPGYLLDFERAYPGAKVLFMQQNYRSNREIVNTANTFIKRNKKRYPKEMFTQNSSGDKPVIDVCLTYEEQIERVLKGIKKASDLKEVAVLYRNNESAIALIDALEKAKIPFYQKDSTHSFFNHFVMRDLKNFFRMAYAGKIRHRALFEDVGKKTKMYLKKEELAHLDGMDPQADLWDAILSNGQIPHWKKTLIRDFAKETRRLQFVKPSKAIRMIRTSKAIGYDTYLDKMVERLGMKRESVFGILEMAEIIAEKEKDLPGFIARLEHLQQVMDASRMNKGKQAVTLSTFHSSKGLEFDTVFMIDLLDGIVPSNSDKKKAAGGDHADMEEATRLFYVAMTRARKHLTMYAYMKRFEDTVRPSGFLSEVYSILYPEKKQSPSWATPTVKPAAVAPVKTPTQKKAKPKAPVQGTMTLDDFIIGDRVQHGSKVGEIMSFSGQAAVCRFPGGPKKVLLSYLKRV